jgi:lipopolysaccharide assembly outer membrane protein LptD (OstA)
MRFFGKTFVLGLTLTALLGVSALAGEVIKTLTLNRDVSVNGTVVKKGTYKVKINKETGEMTILNGKEVIARTTVSLTMDERKANGDEIALTQNGDTNVLKSIKFDGSRERFNVVSAQAAPNQ